MIAKALKWLEEEATVQEIQTLFNLLQQHMKKKKIIAADSTGDGDNDADDGNPAGGHDNPANPGT